MVDFLRDFWILETGTGQQVAQIRDSYMMMMLMMVMMFMMMMIWPNAIRIRKTQIINHCNSFIIFFYLKRTL